MDPSGLRYDSEFISYEYGNEILAYVKCWEFLGQLI
jgi:hypothetical protein